MRTVWFPISTLKVVESSGEWKGMLLLRAIRWNYKLPWHLCKFWIIDGIHSCGIFRTTNQLMARLNEQCLHGGRHTFRASDTIDPIDATSDNQPQLEDAKGRVHVAFVSLHQHQNLREQWTLLWKKVPKTSKLARCWRKLNLVEKCRICSWFMGPYSGNGHLNDDAWI